MVFFKAKGTGAVIISLYKTCEGREEENEDLDTGEGRRIEVSVEEIGPVVYGEGSSCCGCGMLSPRAFARAWEGCADMHLTRQKMQHQYQEKISGCYW